MKKKNNTYQFLNIIEEKKFFNYSQNKKEKFLLENKIYIPRDLKDPHWLYEIEYSDEADEFFFISDLNDLVTREILRYCENYSGFQLGYNEYEKRIKRIINMTLDNVDKEKIIREEHDIYFNILNDNYLTEEYFDESIKGDDMFGCVTLHGIEEDTVYKFITSKHPYLGGDSPIIDCKKIKKSIKILKFLKEEMAKIKDSKEEKVYKPKPTTPLPFNDKIFRTIEAQDWFFNTLNKMGAIEDHNKPIRRKFQPICSAIFYSISCKKHILKYGLKLQDLINFLNKEFKTKIKTKLSVGHLHEDEVSKNIEKFIENNNLA